MLCFKKKVFVEGGWVPYAKSPAFFLFSFQKPFSPLFYTSYIKPKMASLSRSFASAIVNRSYTNAPASVNALKTVFHVSSNTSDEEHHESHKSSALFSAATKQRSVGGLVNRASVNGKEKEYKDYSVGFIN